MKKALILFFVLLSVTASAQEDRRNIYAFEFYFKEFTNWVLKNERRIDLTITFKHDQFSIDDQLNSKYISLAAPVNGSFPKNKLFEVRDDVGRECWAIVYYDENKNVYKRVEIIYADTKMVWFIVPK